MAVVGLGFTDLRQREALVHMGAILAIRNNFGGNWRTIKKPVVKPPPGLRSQQGESPDTIPGRSLPGAHRALAYAFAAADGPLFGVLPARVSFFRFPASLPGRSPGRHTLHRLASSDMPFI